MTADVTEQGSPPGLPLEALRRYLDSTAPGLLTGELVAEVIAGGRSNLTYRVGDGTRTVIVRRPPLGHVLATAHDMAREYRVISALRDTAVPVPTTYLLCADASVIGAPFYAMADVPGTVYRHAEQLVAIGPDRTRIIALRMIATLAALHDVDPAAVGLGDFGRPAGFLYRQVERWHKQLVASYSRDLPGADELYTRLAATVPPESDATVVHGDFRLDNLIVDGSDRVAAVLDWEMATLGDPLADIAMLYVYNAGRHTVVDGTYTAPGYPEPQELLEQFAQVSGRDISGLAFYIALAYYKLAVIAEGIHYRYLQGQTVGEGYETFGADVPLLISAGLEATEGRY